MKASDNKQDVRRKNTTANVVYSMLIFVVVFTVGTGLTDSEGFASHKPHSGSMVSFGLGVLVAIVFSMWFGKRNKP